MTPVTGASAILEHERKAIEASVKCAAALLRPIAERQAGKVDAVLYAALALYHACASDPDEFALARAEEVLREMKGGK